MGDVEWICTAGCDNKPAALRLLNGIPYLCLDIVRASQVERLVLLDPAHKRMRNEFPRFRQTGPGGAVVPVDSLHGVVR